MIETIIGQRFAVKSVLKTNLEGVDHEASLMQPQPGGDCLNWIETVASLIGVIAFHRAYRVGQVGLGRRLVGLDGAIA